MTTHEILVKARNLIASENRWTSGYMCDATGRYCAVGAVGAVLWGADFAGNDPYALNGHPAIAALNKAIGNRDTSVWGVIDYNDVHHHEVVLSLFDRAITATAPPPDFESVTVEERELTAA